MLVGCKHSILLDALLREVISAHHISIYYDVCSHFKSNTLLNYNDNSNIYHDNSEITNVYITAIYGFAPQHRPAYNDRPTSPIVG